MLLIIETDQYQIKYCEIKNGVIGEASIKFDNERIDKLSEGIRNNPGVGVIAYVLYNGGGEITQSVTALSPEVLRDLGKTVKYLPEYNDPLFKIIKVLYAEFPEKTHLLLCETAFFQKLPDYASLYAIPYGMSAQGIRRHGGFGLFHEWASETACAVFGGKARKVISIFLGNRSNIAAIKDSQPYETTMGFSPTEGLPSNTACGNIDPTIVFELFFNGMALDEITKFLSKKSGFSGMLGKKCEFKDLLERKDGDEELLKIRKMFIYNIVKYVGEFAAILGGVDAIAFGAQYSVETMRFITEICNEMQFLNLKMNFVESPEKDRVILTNPDSKVGVLFMHYSKWKVIEEKCDSFVRGLL